MSDTAEVFEGWAILELMGHRRLAGWLSEATIGGGSFIRIDVPSDDEAAAGATQFYAPASVYAITPTTEDVARSVARRNQPAPVQRWELPALAEAKPDDDEVVDDFDDDYELEHG